MNLENSIKDVITTKLEDGTIEKLIAEELEKGIQKTLYGLFNNYGDISKVIESKIKSVMIPYLENYDYSEYIVKLDTVLIEILQNTTLENKDILENFKKLMQLEEKKEITVTELFAIWKRHVAENIDTSDLEVVFDDGPQYESSDVTLEVEYEENRFSSCMDYAKITFECEKDEEMNMEIRISKYNGSNKKGWEIINSNINDIHSLKYIKEMDLLLMKLDRADTKIIIDTEDKTDYVEADAEPEADFS